ncbi:hypothetical protein HAX54_030614 [Datura stramonium]|uniref:Uncharacterized protein n=1 Tax=Datura stramonium TaxID=4076 RepID=A0ABS8SB77_DATST|nr:hypothetical protein [Datura stramonium]
MVGNQEKDLANTRGLCRCRCPPTPGTPVTPTNISPTTRKENVWRSASPRKQSATRRISAEVCTSPLTLTLPLFMTGSTVGTPDLSITRSAESFWVAKAVES